MRKTLGQRILSNPLYPRLPQTIFLIVFVFALSALLWGPDSPQENFGSVMIWILWWPLIPLSFVFLGRIWCALCPWGALSDWLQSHICLGRPITPWIKKHG